jgi:hypothetical protein
MPCHRDPNDSGNLFLLAFFVVGAAIAVVAALPLVILTMICVHYCGSCLCDAVLLHNIIFPCTASRAYGKLAFCGILNLTLAFLHKGTISYLGVVDILKVFRDRFKRVIAKTLSALNVLHMILGVERHIKSLEL